MAAKKLSANLRTLLERVSTTPATFTFEPHGKGVKLVASNISVSQRKHLDTLASDGLVARHGSGDPTGCPPHTTMTYSLTALGRDELDMHTRVTPAKNFTEPASESRLLDEANNG